MTFYEILLKQFIIEKNLRQQEIHNVMEISFCLQKKIVKEIKGSRDGRKIRLCDGQKISVDVTNFELDRQNGKFWMPR